MLLCDHEEADTRKCIHVKHALQAGTRKILVSTVDTDVIIILVGIFFELHNTYPDMHIWVGFGTPCTTMSMTLLCQKLGKERSRALPFFHTFYRFWYHITVLRKMGKNCMGILESLSRCDRSIPFSHKRAISASSTKLYSNESAG